jgi:rubredoxin-NAD+ reductase
VLLLGAGLIGCEFANDLILGGYEVQLVAPCEQVMPTLLHPAAAAAVQAGLESLGARFHLGPVLNRLQRVADGLEAHLSDGQVIPATWWCRPSACARASTWRPLPGAGQPRRRGRPPPANLPRQHLRPGRLRRGRWLNLLYVMPLMSCARALAQTLAGNPTAVSYGPMPITVKTPVCPLVVSPPPRGTKASGPSKGRAPTSRCCAAMPTANCSVMP